MEEKVFFDHADVKVTSARFVNAGQTSAMSNVTSVKAFEEKANRLGGIVLLVVGFVMAVNVPILGLLVAAVAGGYLYHQKPMYHVMLATAGGEVSALKTRERAYLDKIVAAMNEAIVARG